MKLIKSVKGFTLIETILVVAVAGGLVMLGLQAYQQPNTQAQFNALQYNVDLLFQAMRAYHASNCRGTYNASQAITAGTAGTLNPASGVDTTVPFPISNIATGLGPVSGGGPGYLPKWPLPPNIFIGADPVNNPSFPVYVVQFNPDTVSQISYNACTALAYAGTPPNTLACTSNNPITPSSAPASPSTGQAAVLIWRAQVAAQVYNPGVTPAQYQVLVQTYAYQTGADCVSSWNGTYVKPCSTNPVAPVTNAYLVWERLPSYASSGMTSTFWQSVPLLKQFNLQYEHDQMYEFNVGYTGASTPQYYLCGG